MHAHWVDVFDGTDDDGVVGSIADNFHFVFFPTQQGLIHKDLRHRGCFHPSAAEMFVFFAVIRHAAAGAAHGKGRADNGGQADFFEGVERDGDASGNVEFIGNARGVYVFGRGGDDCGLWVFNTQTIHGFAEQLAIFGHFNGFAFRADHFNARNLKNRFVCGVCAEFF